jgi:hypothetical protein
LNNIETRDSDDKKSPGFFSGLRACVIEKTAQEKVFILIYLAVLITISLIRVRLLSTPFERDEGEYAYIGQTLLHGGKLFRDAFTMKLPGTSMMYALWMLLFGESVEAIHIGLLITNIISAFLVLRVAKAWGGTSVNGIIASVIFLMLSVSQSALCFAAHATHFVVFFCLFALLIFESALKKDSILLYFIAGIFFGLSLFMKQQGALFLLLPLVLLIKEKRTEKVSWIKAAFSSLPLIIGAFVPIIALSMYLSAIGTFNKFYFWIFQYSSAYGSRVDSIVGSLILLNSLGVLIERTPLFWISCLAGIVYSFTLRKTKYAQRSLLFLGAGVLVVTPGFYFREHYFVALFPALALTGALLFDYMQSRFSANGWGKYGSAVILCLMLLISLAIESPYYFVTSPDKVVEKTYGKLNVFTSSKMIGEYLKKNTLPTDKIQVLGSEPQIYFFSNRRSASGHIYMYGLMENHEYAKTMQRELAQDIITQKPKYLVFSLEKSSWMLTPESNMWLWEWYKNYTSGHYVIDCLGVLDKDTLTNFVWGKDIRNITSPMAFIISKRVN